MLARIFGKRPAQVALPEVIDLPRLGLQRGEALVVGDWICEPYRTRDDGRRRWWS